MFPAPNLHNYSPTGYNNVPHQPQRSPFVENSQTGTDQQQHCQPLPQSKHQQHQRLQSQRTQQQNQQQNQQQYHQNQKQNQHMQQQQYQPQQQQQNYLHSHYQQTVNQPRNTLRQPHHRGAIRIKTDAYMTHQPNPAPRSRLINVSRGQMQGSSTRQPLPPQQLQSFQLHQRQYGTNQHPAPQQNQWQQQQQKHRVLLKEPKVLIRPDRVINNRYTPYTNRPNTPNPKKIRTLEEWGFTESDVAEFENGPWFKRTGCLICSRWFKNTESYLFHQNCIN